jgi:hypothetical protein
VLNTACSQVVPERGHPTTKMSAPLPGHFGALFT